MISMDILEMKKLNLNMQKFLLMFVTAEMHKIGKIDDDSYSDILDRFHAQITKEITNIAKDF